MQRQIFTGDICKQGLDSIQERFLFFLLEPMLQQPLSSWRDLLEWIYRQEYLCVCQTGSTGDNCETDKSRRSEILLFFTHVSFRHSFN